MRKTITALALTCALAACLTGCGMDKGGTKTTNAGYRADPRPEWDGQYYAAEDGRVYDAQDPERAGLLGNFRDMADDAADGVRRAGNALGDTIDDVAD